MADKPINGAVEKFIDFKKIVAIIEKNWMVLRSDRLRLITMMIFPLIMILIFGATAGQLPKHIPAALVDYDHTTYSYSVQQQLYTNNLFSISHIVGSQDEGRALIDSGQIKILFIIPQGFGDNIASGRPAILSVIIDQSDPSVAQITQAFTQAFVEQMSQQLSVQRSTALSVESHRLSQYLKTGNAFSKVYDDNRDESTISSINSNYVSAQRSFQETDRTVKGVTSATLNSLGVIIDPNSIPSLYTLSDYNGASVAAASSLIQAQQVALRQVSVFQGIKTLSDSSSQKVSDIYAGSNSLYSDSLKEKQSLKASSALISSAAITADQIANSSELLSKQAISLSQINPYGTGRAGLDFLIPSILALIVFQGAVMGMGRAIAGERHEGSLTRVFLTPTSNLTILSGTLLFYVIFETIRSSLVVFAAILLFGVLIKGSILSVIFIIAIYAIGCTGVGLTLSVLANSQEQFQAFAMLLSLPSMFLAGVFLPIETMPPVLQGFTKVLPLTYASDALRDVMIKGFGIGQIIPDMTFLVVFAIFTLALSVMLFKRESV